MGLDTEEKETPACLWVWTSEEESERRRPERPSGGRARQQREIGVRGAADGTLSVGRRLHARHPRLVLLGMAETAPSSMIPTG